MDLVERASKMSVAEVAELLAKDAAHDEQIRRLHQYIDWLTRQVNGAVSERRALKELSSNEQLWLGEEMLNTPAEPPAQTTTVAEYERKERKRPTILQDGDSRLRFDESVPVQVIEVPNPAIEGVPAENLVRVGQKETFRLAQKPASYVVLKYVQTTYRLKETDLVLSAPVPSAVFDRSYADVSLLAGMLVDKFQFHLPLHRQHQRMLECGLKVSRSTLTRLVHRVGELLEPIYHALTSSILQSKVLAMDESPTPAGRAEGKIKNGYFWAMFGDQSEVAFMFSPSRGRNVIDKYLAGFQGCLLTDGYAAYTSFVKANPGISHAQCWAHTRRKFIEAEKVEPGKSAHVIALLQKLYVVEEQGRENPEHLSNLRANESTAIVNELFAFFHRESEASALVRSNLFNKALEYALDRERELRVFLTNSDVPIDTNHLERTLRGPAVGRKNWMFHITEVGARHGAIFYSLLQSCVLAGVRPYDYLVDVIQRVSSHPAQEVHLLTPREWSRNFATDPMRSNLV